jgi:hypothetical protein
MAQTCIVYNRLCPILAEGVQMLLRLQVPGCAQKKEQRRNLPCPFATCYLLLVGIMQNPIPNRPALIFIQPDYPGRAKPPRIIR